MSFPYGVPNYDWDKVDKNYHVPVVCTDKECNGCQFCAGGLYACSVCGCIEGSMASMCPGRRLTTEEEEMIYAGDVDYNWGQWWVSSGPNFPKLVTDLLDCQTPEGS